MLYRIRMPKNEQNTYITGKSVHILFKALSGHFKGNYDAVKYNFKGRVSNNEYAKHRSKSFFDRISKRFKLYELVLLFTSNLVSNPDAWIGEIINTDAVNHYKDYLIRLRNQEQIYRDDIRNIYYFSKEVEVNALKEVFDYNEQHQTSYILKLLQTGIINYETFVLLDSFLNIIEEHDEKSTDIIWKNSFSPRLSGYREISLVDKDKAKKIFIEVIKECSELYSGS